MDSTATPSTNPPHTGLLRDETLVLRGLFGYTSLGRDEPESVLGKKVGNSTLRNVRFLSIDVNALDEDENAVIQQCHMGVSILDSASLMTAKAAIESHHYVVGPDPAYAQRKSQKYLFGAPEAVKSPAALREKIGRLAKGRDTVLVAHGARREEWVLASLGLYKVLAPLHVVDTAKAAQHPLRLSYRCGLGAMLDALGVPHAGLHAAGNDAHFALRGLLMLAVRDAEREMMAATSAGDGPGAAAEALPKWLARARAVAQALRPLTKAEMEEEKAMKAKEEEGQGTTAKETERT